MTLDFPNPTRSFDETRNAIRFVGYDGMFEVNFLIEVAAFVPPDTRLQQSGTLAARCLSAFDTSRPSIHNAARKAYSNGRRNSYTLTRADFR